MAEWSFPDETQYRRRASEVQAALRARGIDILVTSGQDTRRYLGGVDGLASIRPIWLVLPAEGEAEFVSPRLETAEIRTMSWIPVTQEWIEWDDPAFPERTHLSALQKVLNRLSPDKAKTIGVDFYQSSASSVDTLRGGFGADRVVDASDLLVAARLIKDDGVLGVVRQAADIALHQYKAIREQLTPGLTEWEVSRIARVSGMDRAAEWIGDDERFTPVGFATPLIQAGRGRSAHAHGLASTTVIKDGDIVQLCLCGMPVFGHSVGFDRPVKAGDAQLPDDVRRVIGVAEEAQAAALAAIEPGRTAGDVHAAAIAVVAKHDLIGALRHRTGRGLGSSEVEFPELKHGDTTVLQPGMIFAVEPGIYAEGITSARFGDTVLVTDGGYEVLTDASVGHDI